jgi:hypothetical protein
VDVDLHDRPADPSAGLAEPDLLDAHVDVVVVHHLVEELGDVGVQREGRHPPTADELRVDRARRPGPDELVLGAESCGPGEMITRSGRRARAESVASVVSASVSRAQIRARACSMPAARRMSSLEASPMTT